MITEEIIKMEQQLNDLETKQTQTHEMVTKIYSVLIGDEFNKADSMQSKIQVLQHKVNDLETDKVKRDAKMAIYLVICSFAGTIFGALLIAYLSNFIKK